MISHTGTETRSRLLREAAVGDIGQWAQADPLRRGDEGAPGCGSVVREDNDGTLQKHG